jgi:cardiolipin synthase
VIVCWKFDLLPRWALAVLAVRELFMLAASRFALRHGLDLEIKMLGRWAVWPTMFSLFLAMVSVTWVADVLLYIGLAMTLATTVEYVVDARKQYKDKPSTSA